MAVLVTTNLTIEKRRSRVREMCGNVTVTDLPDTVLGEKLERGDNWMSAQVDKFTWSDADALVQIAFKAAEEYTAAEWLDGIPTDQAREQAAKLRADMIENIKTINELTSSQKTPYWGKTQGRNGMDDATS